MVTVDPVERVSIRSIVLRVCASRDTQESNVNQVRRSAGLSSRFLSLLLLSVYLYLYLLHYKAVVSVLCV